MARLQRPKGQRTYHVEADKVVYIKHKDEERPKRWIWILSGLVVGVTGFIFYKTVK